jgi:hypothetical protein
MMSTYWRDKALTLPVIPWGRDAEPLSDEDFREWRYIHEQAEKERERERELQAKARDEQLRDKIEQLAWALKASALKEFAERELDKNQASAVTPAGEKARVGRPSKEQNYLEMLREIRAQHPKSDGETEFRANLTKHADKWKRVSKVTARRWYNRINAALAQENGRK